MKKLCSALTLPLLTACATTADWRPDEALVAETVELRLDDHGRMTEIEYHVPVTAVPEVVIAAMERFHPGGTTVGAEKEYLGSTLYWEISKQIRGLEVEAMFLPDGRLHAEELEVTAASVPADVRAEVARLSAAVVTKWEEVRDSRRDLVEYHAKTTEGGRNYKIRVSPDGEILGKVREVLAEVEVPAR